MTVRALKVFWLHLAVLGVALALAGCSSRPLPAARGSDSPLTVAVPVGNLSDALEAAAAEYSSRAGEPVQVVALDSSLYDDQVSVTLLAGLDHYDLVYLPPDALGKWVGYKTLRSFDEIDTAGLEPWLPALTVEGKRYGLPVQPDIVVVWYRADLLQEAGLSPPRTWAAFQQAAVRLQTPERAGAAVAGSDVDAAVDFAAVLATFGGQALVEDAGGYRVALQSQQALQALAFYTGPYLAGQVNDAGASLTRADVVSALQAGRAALGIAPLSAARVLTDCQSAPLACRDGSPAFAWAWLPNLDETQAPGSVAAWVMPLNAARPQAAQRFAEWLAGPQGGRVWALNGGTPAHREALSGEGTPEEWSALRRVERLILPLPALSTSAEVWRAYHNAVHAAAVGEQSPEAALSSAALNMQRSLRMGGY